jgi:predicted 3-demethylubiquinone-9 3-methyltransferase (glyoxalase superfamily)
VPIASQSDEEEDHAMQQITPFLWFDSNAEEAAQHYVSIFPNAKIGTMVRYGKGGAAAAGRPEGSVMTISFSLNGQELIVLNGGPVFNFSPAISFVVNCESQEEVDVLWEKLSEGGKPGQCGWLTDKFGVSWQIVPRVLVQLLQDHDAEKSQRVMNAMLQMTKLDITRLQQAYIGR